jgi:hypothetical protein
MAVEPTKNRLPEPDAAPNQPAGTQELLLDDAGVLAAYANSFRITRTFEEVVIDFALNPYPPGTQGQTLKVSQRVVLSMYSAKRLLSGLATVVQAHEQAFGVLETDVRKRFQGRG